MNNLQAVDPEKSVPNDVKNLLACTECKLILTEHQWRKQRHGECPNCQEHRDVDGHYLCADFVGMISVMMVKDSWVARWNEIMPNAQPGVYAINVPQPAYDEYANMM